jgi:hypothetical protein
MNKELDSRIETARLAGNNKRHTADEFRHYLLILGLLEYESEILPYETGKPYIPFTGCETTLVMPPRSVGKIIPFPGVSLETGGSIQDMLNDFIREMGYIE